MELKKITYIKVSENGPYLVFGNPKIVEQRIRENEEGASWEYVDGQEFVSLENPIALCRCGKSKKSPFCDGSHEKEVWDAEETADFSAIIDGAEIIEGPNLTLYDNEKYCAYARFCDARGRVWNLVMEGTPQADALAKREVCHCCAGRLILKDKKGQEIEENLAIGIGVLEDDPMGISGPLWIKGGIRVESADGRSYEVRNRQTLCRCGGSSNKPFCDGTHASMRYEDRPRDRKESN